MNTYSATSPTGGTQIRNGTANPLVRQVAQSQFLTTIGTEDLLAGARCSGKPFRLASQMINWSGSLFWQDWEEAGGLLSGPGYPILYRSLIQRGNAAEAALLTMQRVQPQRFAPAPIAIAQYALNTQQIYVGSDYAGGSY